MKNKKKKHEMLSWSGKASEWKESPEKKENLIQERV